MTSLMPKGGDRGQPGKEGVLFGLDWFAFTVLGTTAEQVVVRMTSVLGDEWRSWETLKRGDRWEKRQGPLGSLLEVNWKDRWVHVQLKGQACAALGTEAVLALHDALHAHYGDAYRAKRVDLAWDDYSRKITPAAFRRRFWDRRLKRKRPEVVSRAKKGHVREDDSPEGGGSYQVGERCSNRMLRVYDKRAESGGRIDAIRFELECKGRIAEAAIRAIAASTGNRSAAALRFLVGFVDFRENPGKAVRQRPRCAWWARLVGDAETAELRPRERGDLEEWRANFTKQTSSGFRLLIALHGGDVLSAAEEVMRGNPRDNPRHRRWHEDLRRKRRDRSSGGREAELGDGDGPV